MIAIFVSITAIMAFMMAIFVSIISMNSLFGRFEIIMCVMALITLISAVLIYIKKKTTHLHIEEIGYTFTSALTSTPSFENSTYKQNRHSQLFHSNLLKTSEQGFSCNA